ncbi:MAG: leucine-rich repeat domain-containing protein [Bacteroidaceae bacterium]|nr:leucine-rich repeat domain-containing protein [Bacteroidaceae bacterium]
MKKINYLLTALLLSCCSVVTAHDFEFGGIFYKITDATNKTVEVTYRDEAYDTYDEYADDVTIPESVSYDGVTYSVTGIGTDAFRECYGLVKVIIPGSITSIGENAFRACILLSDFEIPGSVTTIGAKAFEECKGLASVEIPNSVTIIGDSAFYKCSGIASLSIGAGVKTIGRGAFWGCSSLKDLRIEDSNATLKLEHIAYSSKGTFYDSPLETIYLGRNLNYSTYAYDGTSPFVSKTTLKTVTISDCVTEIWGKMFRNCTALTEIEIPNSVTIIGAEAFYLCTGIKSLTIGNGIKIIKDEAFSSCKIRDVYINDLEVWCNIDFGTGGSNPFNVWFKNLYLNGEAVTDIVIPDGITEIKEYAFYYCNPLASIKMPENVKSIGSSAFTSCAGLTSIEIPSSVKSIGNSAFSSCKNLKEVHINDIVAWCNIDFNKNRDANPLYYARNLYLNGNLVTDLVIPDCIKEIKGYSFYNCSCLTSIEIPSSVTTIGEYAFYGCEGLTNVEFPNSVTSIGTCAFRDCTGLASVEFPNSITSIPYHGFSGCSSLESVKIPNSIKTIEGYAFSYCSNLANIEIPNSVTSIGTYAFNGCSFTSIDIPNSVEYVQTYAFNGCTNLEKVYISSSIKSIGSSAFAKCSYISEIKIGSNEPTAITASSNIFADIYSKAILYVPLDCKNKYEGTSPWSTFHNIVEMDFTDIDELKEQRAESKDVCYDLNGRAVKNPINGIYIIDGKKVLLK